MLTSSDILEDEHLYSLYGYVRLADDIYHVTIDSIALHDSTKGSLPDETRRNENDINEVDTNEDSGRKDNNE